MHSPAYSRLQRHLAVAFAIVLGAMPLPGAAASAEAVVDRLITTSYLAWETCNGLGMIGTQLLQELGSGQAAKVPVPLSHEQVRAIATSYDAINLHLCNTVRPMLSASDAWVRRYREHATFLASPRLDGFLADELAMKWARIAAGFRTEILMLDGVIQLELGLRRDAFRQERAPLVDLQSPAVQRLLKEIRLVSLTDEEARARFVLAALVGVASFRNMMPARFDLDRLARIEAKTRRLGLQFVRKHALNLGVLYDTRMRLLVLDIGNRTRMPDVDAAVHKASAQVAGLASRYRPDKAMPPGFVVIK